MLKYKKTVGSMDRAKNIYNNHIKPNGVIKVFTGRQLLILSYIIGKHGETTSAFLSATLGVSTRTIKAEIKNINEELPDEERVEYAPKKGYIIKNLTEKTRNKLISIIEEERMNSDEFRRINKILTILLFEKNYISMGKIADKLYFSKSSVRKILDDSWRLGKNIEVSQSKGLRINAPESKKRYLLSKTLETDNSIFEVLSLKENYMYLSSNLSSILEEAFIKHHYIISGDSMKIFQNYMLITIIRSYYDFVIEEDREPVPVSSLMQEIKEKISERIGFRLSDKEIVYCQKKLNECNVISALPKNRGLEAVYADINARVDIFIKIVRENLSLELEMSENLREIFLLHMHKLKLRTNYGHDNVNYSKREIIRKYPMITHIIYEYFVPLFDFVIADSEIAYIISYFAEFESNRKPIKAVLISDLPMSMLYRAVTAVDKYFQNEIYSLEIIPRYLYKAWGGNEDYSLVITTEKEMLLQNKELVLIKAVMDDRDIHEMAEQIEVSVRRIEANRFEKFYFSYINETMFMKINQKLETTDDFFKFSGLKQNKNNYDFILDSGIILIPGFLYDDEKSFIKIFILKYPLRYKGRDIKMIIASGYNIKSSNIKDFYSVINRLLNPGEVKEILKKYRYNKK